MKQSLIIFITLIFFAQKNQAQAPIQLQLRDDQAELITKIGADKSIDAKTTLKLFHNWDHFPEINEVDRDYIWYYADSTFGKIPVRVFIPATYKSNYPSPAILLLHGAAGISKFSDIAYADSSDDLPVFKGLMNEGYIIIRPIADQQHKFSWVVNKFRDQPNPTYRTLNNMLIALKRILNIDDSKVYAFGHSDGSDGATGIGIYKPDAFAGMIAYNSMLVNIFACNYYIRNIANRPFYLVHSDKDDIRPIQQTREIINALKPVDDTIHYKEYIGYAHFDKHLQLDLPQAIQFMRMHARNNLRNKIYWEASDTIYNTCDWLRIIEMKTDSVGKWYTPLVVKAYNKNTRQFDAQYTYYQYENKPAVIDASYNANMFKLKTSGVGQVEIKISPLMVDMSKPVMVYANNKLIYSGSVMPDKQYIINNFSKTFDKRALWVNAIKLKIN
jgi:hypothetical protein